MSSIDGGWNINISLNSLPEKVATAFGKLKEMVGVEYTPIAYLGSQFVNGINHAVLAEQTVITGRDVRNIVLIIFNEKPGLLYDLTLVGIERIIEGGDGVGFDEVEINIETKDNINKTALRIFDKALGNFVGSVITPFALLATQVVRGINYIYACESTPVIDNDGDTKRVVIVIINDVDGEVQFVDILSSGLNRALGCPLGEWP